MRICLTAILFFLLASSEVFAQLSPTGFPPFGSFQDGQFDSVNRQDLNINFSIPLANSSGRGFNFQMMTTYDSAVWSLQGGAWVPYFSGNYGWKYVQPAGSLNYSKTTAGCRYTIGTQHFSENTTKYQNFSFVDANGTVHSFNVSFYDSATHCNYATGPRSGSATDNSGYVLNATTDTSPFVISPSGTSVFSNGKVEDSNGNFYSPTVVNSGETDWTDSAGHLALKIVTSATQVQYQYPDTAGAYQSTTIKLQSYSIQTAFGCSGVSEYAGTATLPYEIDLANGQKYQFTYEFTSGSTTTYTGRLQRVTLPTGGYYDYQHNPAIGVNCSDGSPLDLTRTVNDKTTSSVWSYSRLNNSGTWRTTVTAPLLPYETVADQSIFDFNSNGQELDEMFFQGAVQSCCYGIEAFFTTWASNGTPSMRVKMIGTSATGAETTYDSNGNLLTLKEHDWGSNSLPHQHNPGGVLRTTTYTYLTGTAYSGANILNRVSRITVADASNTVKSRTDIAYDEATYVNSICVTGAVQHDDAGYPCTYTTRGNPTTVTTYTDPVTPGGAIAKHEYYDSLGNLVKADLNCCQQKQWNYSATTNYAYPDNVVRGSSPQLTTSATYNSFTGLLLTSTDENSQVTTIAYNDPGHLNRTSSVTRPDSAQITYTYDDVNLISTVTSPVQGTNTLQQKAYFDGLGRTIKKQVLDGSSNSYSIVETKFDAKGHVYKISNPHNSTAQYWTETDYDGAGRQIATILQDGSQTATSYASDTTVTTTDPTGKQRKSQFDGLGRLTALFEPDVANSNALTQQTSYSYDIFNNASSIVQGAQTRTFVHDALGRLTDSTTPEAGHFNYQYNSYDLLVQRTDPRGVITTYTYDTLNRPYQTTYNVGTTGVAATSTVTLTYGTNSTLFNNGRLISMTDGTGSENYTYDKLGEMTQLQKVIGTTTFTTSYQYNLAGELTQTTYPSGRAVTQSVDAIGRLSSITGTLSSVNTTYTSGYGYNPAGQVTGFNYGNSVAAAFGFSPDRLQLSTLSYTKGTTPLLSLNYSYGAAGSNNGQIQSITDNVDNGRSAAYSYDALYRLTSAVTTGSASYAKWGLSFSYDRYGNRTTQTVTAGTGVPSNSVAVSATTNQITTAGYGYDVNGNMTNDGQNTLVYDAESRLISSSGSLGSGTYSYDGNGLRIKKISGSTTTLYIFSGSKVIAEYDNGAAVGSPSREYIYSGSAVVAKIDSSGTKYYHQDQLSNRVVTDSSGSVSAQLGHYPFGESWYNGSNDKLLFTSYERDSESVNDFAMARFNVNRLGRFSSPDPFSGSANSPQSFNRYSYTANDPVNSVDPLGLYIYNCGVPGNAPCRPPNNGSGAPPPGGGGGGPFRGVPLPVVGSGERGGSAGVRINKKILNKCTQKLFGVKTNSFSMAVPGHGGAPGIGGSFSGTLTTDQGLQFSFTIYTDVNTYTPEEAMANAKEDPEAPGLLQIDLARIPNDQNLFYNQVQYGVSAGQTLLGQLIETGNGLYGISGKMTLAEIHKRDNSPNRSTTGPNLNDVPGQDLVKCIRDAGGLKIP